jgi:hypothetical protein
MQRYLVESTHIAENCQVGVHTGWAIVEAENESQARLTVPSRLRPKARAIRLSKFTPQTMEQHHE